MTVKCLRSDKANTASFLSDFKNEPLYVRIRGESLKISVLGRKHLRRKVSMFLSKLKIQKNTEEVPQTPVAQSSLAPSSYS